MPGKRFAHVNNNNKKPNFKKPKAKCFIKTDFKTSSQRRTLPPTQVPDVMAFSFYTSVPTSATVIPI